MRVICEHISRKYRYWEVPVPEGTVILGCGPRPALHLLVQDHTSEKSEFLTLRITEEGSEPPSGFGYVGHYDSQSFGTAYLWVDEPHKWLRGDNISIPADEHPDADPQG